MIEVIDINVLLHNSIVIVKKHPHFGMEHCYKS